MRVKVFMATYYRWRRRSVTYSLTVLGSRSEWIETGNYPLYEDEDVADIFSCPLESLKITANSIIMNSPERRSIRGNSSPLHRSGYTICREYERSAPSSYSTPYVYKANEGQTAYAVSTTNKVSVRHANTFPSAIIYKYGPSRNVSSSSEYVYSTNSSAYPNNTESGSYYYDQKTTIVSPTNPTGLTYSQQISSLLIPISWNASTSNISNYPVKNYELSYCLNGSSSWQVVETTTETSYYFGLSDPSVTQIQFRIRAMDTNSKYSDYVTGPVATVQYVPSTPPVLILPQNVKLGTTIAISWNSVQDATNYILQRKVLGSEWTQIYSGSNLSCSNLIDALGISYRICFNVGSNYTSPWSEEYKLSTYEKIIEMTYLGSDGQYMPLYPKTITNAVVNASDLIQTTMLTGKYTGNGMESNEVLLANNIEPKVGFLYDSNGNITGSVGFNDKGNLVVDKNLGFNESGSEYGYVVIGEKNNNDFE